ncbi:Hsp20/alpha crystallin family protein [Thermodesulfobacteriota bacterium]
MSEKELQVHEKKETQQNSEQTQTGIHFVPAVDIYETDEVVTVMAEMPGVSKERVEIDLEDGVLMIKGFMEEPGDQKGKILLQEYETGHFVRKFTISEAIDQEKIEATIKNGLLTLILPKVEPERPRKIAVQEG